MKVKDLLKTEADWVQGTSALNERNNPVGEFSDEAVRFCLSGAVVWTSLGVS